MSYCEMNQLGEDNDIGICVIKRTTENTFFYSELRKRVIWSSVLILNQKH